MVMNIPSLKNRIDGDFKEIYELNFDYVYSFVFSRVSANREITEDIVQETFYSAMKSLHRYKGNSSYKTWLCGIAKNLIFNFYRKTMDKEHISYDECEEELGCFENVELEVINSEARSTILKVLNEISPVYRYVLILKYMDDYSVKEIAKCLCKTPKAIDGILQRAKINFKKEYLKLLGDELSEKR